MSNVMRSHLYRAIYNRVINTLNDGITTKDDITDNIMEYIKDFNIERDEVTNDIIATSIEEAYTNYNNGNDSFLKKRNKPLFYKVNQSSDFFVSEDGVTLYKNSGFPRYVVEVEE